jgi:hypothetical protein
VHNGQVLTELGITGEEIDALLAAQPTYDPADVRRS